MKVAIPELIQKYQDIGKGDIIPLRITDDRHNNDRSIANVPESTALNFAELLNRAMQKVSDQAVESEKLTQQMISDPGSVQMHSVTIAAEKARMALTFTKTVTDLAVKTYRDLVNLR